MLVLAFVGIEMMNCRQVDTGAGAMKTSQSEKV
jgi:hypothetical protein